VNDSVVEHPLDCPYCGAPITMLLDPSSSDQAYIEDCEVCCNPIEVRFRVEEGEVVELEARTLD
jgi:nitrite reductase/ring-hydroxylating ferredoxin subunit